MDMMKIAFTLTAVLAVLVSGQQFDAQHASNPYQSWSHTSKRNGLTVDLGYELYTGGATDGLYYWKGQVNTPHF